ncbi:MAG TPA: hypothetical protein DDW76_26485, partial [Cyanobacteria bacterium UBA11369]|nr:hypothetical protein [Cyanobacteria bacterium UBA11369]
PAVPPRGISLPGGGSKLVARFCDRTLGVKLGATRIESVKIAEITLKVDLLIFILPYLCIKYGLKTTIEEKNRRKKL